MFGHLFNSEQSISSIVAIDNCNAFKHHFRLLSFILSFYTFLYFIFLHATDLRRSKTDLVLSSVSFISFVCLPFIPKISLKENHSQFASGIVGGSKFLWKTFLRFNRVCFENIVFDLLLKNDVPQWSPSILCKIEHLFWNLGQLPNLPKNLKVSLAICFL